MDTVETARLALNFVKENQAAVIGVIAAPPTVLIGYLTFYRNYREYRFFNVVDRLNKLSDSIEDSCYQKAILERKKEEISRKILGFFRSPSIREKAINLYVENCLDSQHIEASAVYLKETDSGRLFLGGKFLRLFMKSMSVLVFLFTAFVLLLVAAIYTWNLLGENLPPEIYVLVPILVAACLILFAFYGEIFRGIVKAEKFEKFLKEHYLKLEEAERVKAAREVEAAHVEALKVNYMRTY